MREQAARMREGMRGRAAEADVDALAGDAEAWWGVPHLLQRRIDWCRAPAGHCRRRCWRSCGRFGNPSIRGGSGLANGGGKDR